ncbi:PPE domain-containing protein [Nocardia amamiensis]|uniref:PPE domain-containing protein n=1 Tax=Nocardia amamiensis TaxID=404578 RepID=A0ABS0CVD2_9NOCA|nr:PPE domain-containing protein [Nocardia amamiensis]MBF6300563.1 PPE domain-containing protein [Nocardia amamiensis]
MPSSPFAFAAKSPEENIYRLKTGPGAVALEIAADAYTSLAAALATTASGTDASMNAMGYEWQGPSSEQAQAAFRQHADWLHRQAAVAEQAAHAARGAQVAYSTALAAMLGVEAWLITHYAKKAAVAAVSTTKLAPLAAGAAVALAIEYQAIRFTAAAVMSAYDGAAHAALATLPEPEVPSPIVFGGGPEATPPGTSFENPVTKHFSEETGNRSIVDPGDRTGSGDKPGDPGTDPGTDPGKPPPDPTDPTTPDPTQPVEQAPVDSTSSSPSDSLANPSLDGSDTGSMEPQGFSEPSLNSTTLAGLNGGVGSMVALNMARGGLGAMPGASSGFRMPSNWSLGRGTAFGATSNPTAAGPASRNTPPRGATAPKAQMRRRRRDEDREKSKVFVPGEPQEVPVLEQPPVIGVIEYADPERREEHEESEIEQLLLVGVIGVAADEPAVADPERAR